MCATAVFDPRGSVRGATPTNASSRGEPVEARAAVLAGDDPRRVLEQVGQPPIGAARAAGQEVLGAVASVDLEPAVGRPGPGSQFHQSARLAVEHPELDRAMALGSELAGEPPPVGERDPAAQPPTGVADRGLEPRAGRRGGAHLPSAHAGRAACLA